MWLIEERRLEKKVKCLRKDAPISRQNIDIEKALRKALRIIRDDLDEVTPTQSMKSKKQTSEENQKLRK